MSKQGRKQLQHTPTLLQICISRPQHVSAKRTWDAPNSFPQDTQLISNTAALLGNPTQGKAGSLSRSQTCQQSLMPPWARDQGTQQQTQLIEAYTEHLREALGQEPDCGPRATACCLQHQKQVPRSRAVQQVEKSSALPPQDPVTSLQAMECSSKHLE